MLSEEVRTADARCGRQVMQMIWGYMTSQALHAAAKLSVFDLLAETPRTAGELASATGAEEGALRRLLRFLTSIEMLTEDDRGAYSPTELGAFLMADHPQSLHSYAVQHGEPLQWRAWGDLYETVRTGTPGFDRVHGAPFFDFLDEHPREGALYLSGLAEANKLDFPPIVDAYDFSRFKRIVDVGGGHGAFLRGILDRCPDTEGVLCDLPSVIARAADSDYSRFAGRCTLVEADMFDSLPAGGDAYVLKMVLHDWTDEDAIRVLRNCRAAMEDGATLLVIEAVLKPPNQPDLAKLIDLNMLVMLTGRERTEDEYRALYEAAGFRLTRVYPAMRLSIIEGAPV